MKKLLYIFTIGTTLFLSCKKDNDKEPEVETPVADQTAPVITLNGNKKDTVILGTSYTDPGATALDNKDGNISPFIIVSGALNTNMTGDYLKNYDVRDAAGNASHESRNIHVKNEAQFITGTYAVACSCSTIQPGAVTQTKTITYTSNAVVSSTVNGSFTLSHLDLGRAAGAAPSLNLSLNGNDIYGINPPGSLSGTVSINKTTFTLSSTTYDQNSISTMVECKNVFTKQ